MSNVSDVAPIQKRVLDFFKQDPKRRREVMDQPARRRLSSELLFELLKLSNGVTA